MGKSSVSSDKVDLKNYQKWKKVVHFKCLSFNAGWSAEAACSPQKSLNKLK